MNAPSWIVDALDLAVTNVTKCQKPDWLQTGGQGCLVSQGLPGVVTNVTNVINKNEPPRENGETRAHARGALKPSPAYWVLVFMPDMREQRWITLVAPGCDIDEAKAAAVGTFGPERVLDIQGVPAPLKNLIKLRICGCLGSDAPPAEAGGASPC